MDLIFISSLKKRERENRGGGIAQDFHCCFGAKLKSLNVAKAVFKPGFLLFPFDLLPKETDLGTVRFGVALHVLHRSEGLKAAYDSGERKRENPRGVRT